MPDIDIQIATECSNLPSNETLITWCSAALSAENTDAELVIRIVDEHEIQALNLQYRDKDSPTNVLSFPCELPPELELNILGDIIICASIVSTEAEQQNKTLDAHWAHMLIHGTLHLQGYDHIEDNEAFAMEQLETKILKELGFAAPYETTTA